MPPIGLAGSDWRHVAVLTYRVLGYKPSLGQ